jgi:hypothetical protein
VEVKWKEIVFAITVGVASAVRLLRMGKITWNNTDMDDDNIIIVSLKTVLADYYVVRGKKLREL